MVRTAHTRRELKLSYTADRNKNSYSTFENSLTVSQKIKYGVTTQFNNSTTTQEKLTHMFIQTLHMNIFTAAFS